MNFRFFFYCNFFYYFFHNRRHERLRDNLGHPNGSGNERQRKSFVVHEIAAGKVSLQSERRLYERCQVRAPANFESQGRLVVLLLMQQRQKSYYAVRTWGQVNDFHSFFFIIIFSAIISSPIFYLIIIFGLIFLNFYSLHNYSAFIHGCPWWPLVPASGI